MPTSALASAAEQEGRRRLSPALVNHSYRTYAFGAALGALANIDVDDVAEKVGLSTAATKTMRTAITLHPSPGVALADGPVA